MATLRKRQAGALHFREHYRLRQSRGHRGFHPVMVLEDLGKASAEFERVAQKYG